MATLNVNLNISSDDTRAILAAVNRQESAFVSLFTILQELRTLMSALSDALADLKADIDAKVDATNAHIADLKAQIATLETKEGFTQADLDMIAELKAKVAALDPTDPAVLPPTT